MKAKEKAYIHFTDLNGVEKPAAYREKAPTVGESNGLLDFMDWHCKWQDTIIAYMKDDTFEVGEDVCKDGLYLGKIIEINKEWVKYEGEKYKGEIKKKYINENYSHYCEGQVIDLKGYKYVGEGKVYRIMLDSERMGNREGYAFVTEEGAKIIYSAYENLFGGQSMDRREERGGICWLSELNEWIDRKQYPKGFNWKDYEVKDNKVEWQEVKEPSRDDYQSIVGIKFEVSEEHLIKETNKFQDSCHKGGTLLTPI